MDIKTILLPLTHGLSLVNGMHCIQALHYHVKLVLYLLSGLQYACFLISVIYMSMLTMTSAKHLNG